MLAPAEPPGLLLQAVDVSAQIAGDLEIYRDMLAVPNVDHTKGLPGWVKIHVGMRVRFTTDVLLPWAHEGATGVVVELDLSAQDRQRSEAAAGEGEMVLAELPRGAYVKLDECRREFLPPIVCQKHKEAGFCKDCLDCRAFVGCVLVQPICKRWTFTHPVTEVTLQVKRCQLPLLPEAACLLYSLRGAYCDPGLIAHFVMPRRADENIKWLIVYLMLSRVRSLSCLRSIGLTLKIRKIIEGGLPSVLAKNVEDTNKAAKAAKAALGWP